MATNRINFPSGFLPGVATKFKGTAGRFLVERALPAEPGAAHKGTILTMGASFMLPNPHEDGKRLPGGTVQELPPISTSGVDYHVELYSISRSVPKELQKRASAYFNMSEKISMGMLNSLKTQQDISFVADINGATWVYDDTLAGGELWNTATGLPLADMQAAAQAVRLYAGSAPLSAILPRPAWNAFIANTQIRGVMATDTDRAFANEDWFLRVVGAQLGIAKIYIFDTVVNSSGDPDSPSLAYADDDFVWIGVLPADAASYDGGDVMFDFGAFARVAEYEPYLQEDWDYRTQSTVITGEFSEAIVLVDTNLGAIIRNVI